MLLLAVACDAGAGVMLEATLQYQLTLRGHRPPRPGTVPDLQAKLSLGLLWVDRRIRPSNGKDFGRRTEGVVLSFGPHFMNAFSDGTGEFEYASRVRVGTARVKLGNALPRARVEKPSLVSGRFLLPS